MKKNKIAVYLLLSSMMFTTGFKNNNDINNYTITKNIEDESVVNFFKEEKELIKKYINEEKYELAKKKAKDYFITCVDFIFYDKEIKGVKWNDLEESAKKEVYNSFSEVDYLISLKYPDYKDNISDKYEVVKKYTNKAYYKSIDVIRELIGNESFDKLNDSKNKVISVTKETTNKTKVKIKKWYQNYKK